MLVWLLALASLALAQDDLATTGGGGSLSDMTVGEAFALFGGGGSGTAGAGYGIYRVVAWARGVTDRQAEQDALIKSLSNDLAEAIERADDRDIAHRTTMSDMEARLSAAGAPSEADTKLRERLARLEAKHDATTKDVGTLTAAIDGVRTILLQASRD